MEQKETLAGQKRKPRFMRRQRLVHLCVKSTPRTENQNSNHNKILFRIELEKGVFLYLYL
jgi:hypothetical protein